MAREVPNITRIGIIMDTLERLNVPIDEVVEDLPKPKGSEKKVNVGYRANNHAATAEQMHDSRLIPEGELLTGAKYGRRIEIDNVIAYVGAERFWNEFVLPSFQALFDTVDYNLSRKKIKYVMLPYLRLLNELVEQTGTVAAASEEEKIESELADYDISINGFIEDIEALDMDNTKRIENKEFENRHIQWLEKELASLKKEFSRRTGVPLPPEG